MQQRSVRTGRLATFIVAGALAAGLPLTGAQPVSASGPQLVLGTSDLGAVGCPTGGLCIAVGIGGADGATGVVVAITNGSAGPVQIVSGNGGLGAIACPTADTCFAVGSTGQNGSGEVVPITSGKAGAPIVVSQTSYLAGVACPNSTTCYAIGNSGSVGSGDGVIVPIVNGSVGTPRPLVLQQTFENLASIGCSESACLITGSGGNTHPYAYGFVIPMGVDGTPGQERQIPSFGYVRGVACPTGVTCVITGTYAYTNDGASALMAGGVPGSTYAVSGAALSGVACVNQRDCVAAGNNSAGPDAVSLSNAVPGDQQQCCGSVSDDIQGVACMTAASCIFTGGQTPPGTSSSTGTFTICLLYTSPSPRDLSTSRMTSSA